MQQESYKQTSPMHGPRQPSPTFSSGMPPGYPAQHDAPLTKGEPEIFLATNYLNALQDDLTCALEKSNKICIKIP